MDKYIVVGLDELKELDSDAYEDYYEELESWTYPGFLFDTHRHRVVFCDNMQPEDASLERDLRPLIDLLNKESK